MKGKEIDLIHHLSSNVGTETIYNMTGNEYFTLGSFHDAELFTVAETYNAIQKTKLNHKS